MPGRRARIRCAEWPASASTDCAARSASPACSPPPTATSAPRSTTRSGWSPHYALGLTPLVFMFAGGLFALTAKTYAEGAAMFPEAGGSSSFARHAFNEVVSFFAGWALRLDYILTIAISAFFVPHYLSAFFPGSASTTTRATSSAGWSRRAARRAEHPRPGRVGQAQLRPGGRRPLRRRCCWSVLGSVLVLNPSLLIDQVHLGTRADLARPDLRAVGGDGRLHRHRDGLEHGRGGQGPRPRRAQGRQPRADRGARRVRRHLGRRAVGAAGARAVTPHGYATR